MKIVMLCDFYSENQQYQENLLTKYYLKYGHEVTIITSTFENVFEYISNKYDKNKPSRTYFFNEAKIIRQPYKYNVLNKLRKFPNVEQILNEEKPDLIFLHECFLNLKEAATYKNNNFNCKIIMDYHADYSNSGKNWVSINILHKIIRKKILFRDKRSIDQIYPIVPSGFRFLNEIYDIPYDEMKLLPLGVDSDLVIETINNNEGFNVRRKLNIPDDHFVIFTGGKLTPLKQTHLVIEAVVNLNSPRIHLIVVGEAEKADSAYKMQLEKLANRSNYIHFTGWLDSLDVYKYMAASDFSVFPASQSVLWQQSIGMGLPLVIGRYIVLDQEKRVEQDVDYLNIHNNVYPLDEINEESIKNVILKLTMDEGLLCVMKEGAKKTSAEFLSYDVISKITLQ